MGKSTMIVGIIIFGGTILAYIFPLFGKPVNAFWVPIGIVGVGLIGEGWYTSKEDKEEAPEKYNK